MHSKRTWTTDLYNGFDCLCTIIPHCSAERVPSPPSADESHLFATLSSGARPWSCEQPFQKSCNPIVYAESEWPETL